ncbi:class I SAM-dependent methyltransferase [Treponema sp. HNW]|uniref:class I SAM-dependent methyltransferase n=1 Tax=Treponema sp. HNW TaxID=3116654 RepID=UPI003D0FD455
MNSKTAEQLILFENRLRKRGRHLKKWAQRTETYAYRLYDRDIPEIPLCLDRYEDTEGSVYLVLYLYERPYEKDEAEETVWLEAMRETAAKVLDVSNENIFVKRRRRQKNRQIEAAQYAKQAEKDFYITVKESGLLFEVNLSSYLDTGLFFDHRILRNTVRSESRNKSVLNLFCYTGSFSVYAASGGALRVDSVDLSAPYLKRARRNLALNGFTDSSRYALIQSDVLSFLHNTKQSRDIIILDPPTFSNSKKTDTVLDINRDWPLLTSLCINRLNRGGTLYFSANSRSLKFDEAVLRSACAQTLNITDISEKTVPEDFRNKRIHRCIKITRK